MKKLLHIIATPRGGDSRTLRVTESFLEVFKAGHKDWIVEEVDISKGGMPSLTAKRVDGKYALLSGKELSGELKEAWKEILGYIERFLSADAYLISTPMWNFGIPYTLKQYIDIILQPRYLFRYTATGIEGLVKNRKMVVIASRGGDYSSAAMRSCDFQEPYLRAIFGLTGITDIQFIIAQPMDMGQDTQEQKIKEAQAQAKIIAGQF